MKAQKSFFSFDDYSIEKTEYKFNREVASQYRDELVNFSLNFDPEISIEEIKEGFIGNIKLKVSVRGKIKNRIVTKMNVYILGKFSSTSLGEEKFREMCYLNGIATLFQISRAVIVSFTSQTGNTPIIIPLTNIASSIDIEKKKTQNKKFLKE